ncbi:MAG TPA: J domain-containing protein [Sphingobacteriaceae bacterium]
MDFIDYYKVLGVDKNASEADIRKAYRKMARQYHPDLNPDDEAAKKKFQEINEANEVLSDPEKRRKYDQYGKDWRHGEEFEKARQQQHQQYAGQSGRDFGGGPEDPFGGGDFSDFFESMFGGGGFSGRGRHARFRGEDYRATLELNLTDVLETRKQTISVNGKNIRLTIPAGVENGQTIKVAGYGGPGMNGGPAGDLYITFTIRNDTGFRREGKDLYADLHTDLYTAILGGETIMETLTGKVRIKVPPGTQNGTRMKLRGKGLPVYKKAGEAGDLYVTFNVKLPDRLSEREKELFRQLADYHHGK